MKLSFVSAGAGSGKTYKLTEILREAIASGTRPEKIVATTFTNKAADEIRERVTAGFFELGDLAMVQVAPAIMIGTVNGVCGSLLGRFAFEAGLSPRLSVLDVDESAALLNRVLERTVSDDDRSRILEIEDRFGYKRDRENSWLSTVLGLVAAARSNDIDAAGLRRMAERNAGDVLSLFGPALVDPTVDLTSTLEWAIPAMEEAQDRKPQKNSAAYLDKCWDLSTSLKKGAYTWKQWVQLSRGGFGSNCADAGEAVRDSAARWKNHPGLHTDIRDYIGLCFQAATDSLEAFEREKRRGGFIDFVDQECLLHAVLDRADVQDRLREELELLIVDEFQDTSPVQLAVFLKLAHLAKRCVWVGDVKQAIYGFRGSDARLMASVLGSLESLGGGMEILDRSWRSRPELVRLVNEVFVPAFETELPPRQVELKAVREKYTDLPAFEHWILPGNQEEQYGELAKGLQDFVASGFNVMDRGTCHPRPVDWSDIAILVRQNQTASDIRSVLQEAGIPCAQATADLLARPEAALLQACLRRLNDREDTLASAEILGLTEGLTPEDWLEERLDWLAEERGERGFWRCAGEGANPLLAAIEDMRALARLLSPYELARRLVARCGLDRIVTSWSDEPASALRRLSRLDAVLARIEAFEEESRESGSIVSLSSLLLRLAEDADEGDEGDEGPGTGPEESDVQILTYHSAKGLEWPVCLCLETTKEVRDSVWGLSVSTADRFDIEHPLAGRSIRFWPWPFGELKRVDDLDLDTNSGVAEMRAAAAEEARRLLYVGFTRPRDLLVLALPEKAKSGGCLNTLGERANKVLVPAAGAGPKTRTLKLPSGTPIPYAIRTFDEAAETRIPAASPSPLTWFELAANVEKRPAAIRTPSASGASTQGQGSAIPVTTIAYSDSRPVSGEGPARELGSIYHAAVAWAVSNPDVLEHDAPMQDFLQRQIANPAFDATTVRASISDLFRWIQKTWPDSGIHAECPIVAALENGQIVSGRVDLLVETPAGVVVLDHKLSFCADVDGGALSELIPRWKYQLDNYVLAIRATGRNVDSAWINAPRDGVAIRLL